MSQKAIFSQSFRTQLFGYSLGAGATLAAITNASGSIVYSGPQNLTVSAGTDQFIDLNGGGNDLRFYLDPFGNFNNQYVASVSPAAVDNKNFGGGTTINGSTPFSAPGSPELLFQYGTAGSVDPGYRGGEWATGNGHGFTSKRGFLPVRLDTTGAFHYGWVDYQPSPDGSTATIFGYAYETTANAGIAAGAVPEPAESALALGVLALGAAGLHRLRQRQARNQSVSA